MTTTPRETYKAKFEEYKVGNTALLEMLGEELFTSPASTMLDLHNAFEGGLVDHLLRVAKYAVRINAILSDQMKQPQESVIRVALLSEIGKVGIYKPEESKWHRDNLGRMFNFREGLVSMRVGQRSIYYITKAGINLTEAEYQAILNHDTNINDDTMMKWHAEKLTVILRQAIELAIIEEKTEKK